MRKRFRHAGKFPDNSETCFLIPTLETERLRLRAQTMQDLKVLRMTEIDMFFFLVAQERLQTQQLVTYLYRIKNFQIQDRYSCHHEVLQIARCIDKASQSKKIMTFGKDYDLNEKQEINN